MFNPNVIHFLLYYFQAKGSISYLVSTYDIWEAAKKSFVFMIGLHQKMKIFLWLIKKETNAHTNKDSIKPFHISSNWVRLACHYLHCWSAGWWRQEGTGSITERTESVTHSPSSPADHSVTALLKMSTKPELQLLDQKGELNGQYLLFLSLFCKHLETGMQA